MNCPLCSGTMHEVHRSDVEVDVCGDCAALFFDAGELDEVSTLLAGLEARMDDAARTELELDVTCPSCKASMHLVSTQVLQMAVCPDCSGFLLEDKMVEAVARAVAGPVTREERQALEGGENRSTIGVFTWLWLGISRLLGGS